MKSIGFRNFDRGVHATSTKVIADLIDIWRLGDPQERSTSIWELGMGEGYLASALSAMTNTKVIGTDIGKCFNYYYIVTLCH